MISIIILGANSYLGANLIAYLSSSYNVVGVSRSKSPGDFSYNTEEELFSIISEIKPCLVINTIGLYENSCNSTSDILESNLLFPVRVLNKCNELKIKNFFQVGTILDSQLNFYAKSKNSICEIAPLISHYTNFVYLKPHLFFGPGQKSTSFFGWLSRKIENNEPLDLTSGNQKRDFIYIKDLMSAFHLLIRNLELTASLESIEIGNGMAVSIKDFVNEVIRVDKQTQGLEVNFGAIPDRVGEPKELASNNEFLRTLGWKAIFNYKEAIEDIYNAQK
ncbi:NAD-dependent epimerase/dehydratase family protein [Catenovulum sp. SM1970]|uniref:NAD-dependent epimerase/dehydratase family protein n=1 Tax=Marinifaba aquimaris TaxID=2741323 RepID=UPI0015717B27|nr:NAD-dependent epimerase/dehydratase family protein [Marinifaba aquimaris]NTS75351.1 NAD-dependent epimerase/dehydratase family protein [Marinifaba aquimaris]